MLEGNTPRFPRMTIMPSTTMLYRRLTGTTDGSGFYRNTHTRILHLTRPQRQKGTTSKREIRDYIFCPHGGASEAPLNCSIAKSETPQLFRSRCTHSSDEFTVGKTVPA